MLKIEIRATTPARAWHKKLAAALRSDGHRLRLVQVDAPSRMPPGFGCLMAVQRIVFRAKSSAFTPVAVGESANEADFEDAADLVLPLAGTSPPDDVSCLVAQFDGAADERRLMTALFGG